MIHHKTFTLWEIEWIFLICVHVMMEHIHPTRLWGEQERPAILMDPRIKFRWALIDSLSIGENKRGNKWKESQKILILSKVFSFSHNLKLCQHQVKFRFFFLYSHNCYDSFNLSITYYDASGPFIFLRLIFFITCSTQDEQRLVIELDIFYCSRE